MNRTSQFPLPRKINFGLFRLLGKIPLDAPSAKIVEIAGTSMYMKSKGNGTSD